MICSLQFLSTSLADIDRISMMSLRCERVLVINSSTRAACVNCSFSDTVARNNQQNLYTKMDLVSADFSQFDLLVCGRPEPQFNLLSRSFRWIPERSPHDEFVLQRGGMRGRPLKKQRISIKPKDTWRSFSADSILLLQSSDARHLRSNYNIPIIRFPPLLHF
jgi:hypothetical protein